MIDIKSAGDVAIDRLDALARFTDEPGQLTRLYLSPAHKAAALQVLAWMREAGMKTRIDAVGNVVGCYEGVEPGLPALLTLLANSAKPISWPRPSAQQSGTGEFWPAEYRTTRHPV